jgi:deoxyribonuclease IV
MNSGKRRIGVHTSIAGGIEKSLKRASELGCNTLQIFSHNPRGWKIKEKNPAECEAFRSVRQRLGIAPVFVHSSYLINLASGDRDLMEKSMEMVMMEMDIADAIDAEYVVLHTGSAAGDDPASARKRAALLLQEVSKRGAWRAGILLENTAGERGDVASKLADISEMMEKITGRLVAGICLDSCHAFAAGYDIASVSGLAGLTMDIEKYIGRDRVRLIHLNDSRGGLGSGIDRHEHIGKGKIGLKGFTGFLGSPCLAGVPLILETPKKSEHDDPMNLKAVRNIVKKIGENMAR